VAVDWLSSGLDPGKCTLFVQSEIPEHAELHLILSMMVPVPWLERNPTYKEKQDEVKNIDMSSYGFLGYPVLQTADIVLYKANAVPVGIDQVPHLELSREIIRRFNKLYKKKVFIEPEAKISDVPKLNGIDGRKMSKSYNNAIDIFMEEKPLQKRCNKIISSSTPLEEPLDYDGCNIYNIASLFLDNEQKLELQDRYASGKEGYGHFKKYLKELIWEEFGEARERRAYYRDNPDEVQDILNQGAKKARDIADKKMARVREAVGII